MATSGNKRENKREHWAVDVYATLLQVAWACFHTAAITDSA